MMSVRQAQVTFWDDLGDDETEQDAAEQDAADNRLLAKYHSMFDDEPRVQLIRRTKPRREELSRG